MTKRPKIPRDIKRHIFIEAGHRCAVCGTPFPLERAHIIPWSKSHDHSAENLICLCACCHERADDDWDESTLREYKAHPWVQRQNAAPNNDTLPSTTEVKITIALNLQEFTDASQRWLKYALAAFLETHPDCVHIRSIEEGSVNVTMDLDKHLALKLQQAFCTNDPLLKKMLAPLRAKGIELNAAKENGEENDSALLSIPKNTIETTPTKKSASSILKLILEGMPAYMQGIIYSAYMHVLSDDGALLLLATTMQSVSESTDYKSTNAISVNDPTKLSSIAYQTQLPLAKPLNKIELKKYDNYNLRHSNKIEAECSIPLSVGKSRYVLCLQGTKHLLNPNVIECLSEITKAVTIYSSSLSDSTVNSVLILGPEVDKECPGLFNRIQKVLEKHNYESVFINSVTNVTRINVLEKIRHFINQSRFVFIEDRVPSNHIPEILMCAANRAVTAILRQNQCVPNHFLVQCPTDYAFIKEFTYETEYDRKNAFENIIEKAVIWAEGVIHSRKTSFVQT